MSIFSKKSLVIFKNIIKFFELHLLNMFNSLNHMKKLLCESYSKKSVKILWVTLENKEGSILRVIFKKVQFFYYVQKKKKTIHWVIGKKGFNSLSHKKWVQFFELFLKRKKVQFFETCSKVGSILCVMLNRRVQYCVSCWTEGFNSLSHVEQKGSILWVMLNRRVQFFESCWTEVGSILCVIFKKSSSLWVIFKKGFNYVSHIRKIQFFESY